MSDVSAITGTTLGMSATLPTTYDSDGGTGYPSLTFTDIGEIIDGGGFEKVYATLSHQTVGRDYPETIKDTYTVSNGTFTLGRVSTDAGQALLQTALASKASYGDTQSITGKIIKASPGPVASGNIETTMVEVAPDANTLFEA